MSFTMSLIVFYNIHGNKGTRPLSFRVPRPHIKRKFLSTRMRAQKTKPQACYYFPMARKQNRQNKPALNPFTALPPATLRAIVAVVFAILGVFLTLAAFDGAGEAGTSAYTCSHTSSASATSCCRSFRSSLPPRRCASRRGAASPFLRCWRARSSSSRDLALSR